MARDCLKELQPCATISHSKEQQAQAFSIITLSHWLIANCFLHPLQRFLHSHRLIKGECAYARAAETAEVSAATGGLSHIIGEAADIRPG
jgi:hypothetical protein